MIKFLLHTEKEVLRMQIGMILCILGMINMSRMEIVGADQCHMNAKYAV